VPEIPPMREHHMFRGQKTALFQARLSPDDLNTVVIFTDRAKIDYAVLLELGCAVVDGRNAIAKGGLPMIQVTKT
jgi:UDP-N-acetyl-D-glucosamine dehydrogenase